MAVNSGEASMSCPCAEVAIALPAGRAKQCTRGSSDSDSSWRNVPRGRSGNRSPPREGSYRGAGGKAKENGQHNAHTCLACMRLRCGTRPRAPSSGGGGGGGGGGSGRHTYGAELLVWWAKKLSIDQGTRVCATVEGSRLAFKTRPARVHSYLTATRARMARALDMAGYLLKGLSARRKTPRTHDTSGSDKQIECAQKS